MRFSGKFKSSAHCLPSPCGRLVATLLPLEIHVRSVDRLEDVSGVVALPSDLSVAGTVAFQWSPSSRRVLVATSDQIFVAAVVVADDSFLGEHSEKAEAEEEEFRAVIRNPSLPVVAKPTYVGFGPSDDQVLLCSAFGIKLAVFHLRTGKTVEIANPKLYSSAVVCSRGFSHRPGSQHLAVLTRTAGKDWISVHDPESTAVVVASWAPDTVDAQGIVWSPDGRWLVAWESPAHGHKLLFYTPDGHHFKTWAGGPCGADIIARLLARDDDQGQGMGLGLGLGLGPSVLTAADVAAVDETLGSGVRFVQFSANAQTLAVGDASRCIRIIDMSSVVECHRLLHPATLSPQTTSASASAYQVWQEQMDLAPTTSTSSSGSHAFVLATQSVAPPGRQSAANFDASVAPSGCSQMSFDAASTLLATRLEEAPSTVWVWDVEAARLRTVLMFHASVSTAVWHPDRPQTLLITCEGDKHRGLGVIWHPDYDAPVVADFSRYYQSNLAGSVPVGTSHGKHWPSWLRLDGVAPSLFYSDGSDFALAAVDEDARHETHRNSLPWKEAAAAAALPIAAPSFATQRWALDERHREESPLELVPAADNSEGGSDPDDTFDFKQRV